MKDGNRQAESARESDVKRPGNSERVSGIEKVGSKGHGIKFGVPAHPDKSVVRGTGKQ
jgi:hypothetical protein